MYVVCNRNVCDFKEGRVAVINLWFARMYLYDRQNTFSGTIVRLYDRFSDDLGVNERLLFEILLLVYFVTRIMTLNCDWNYIDFWLEIEDGWSAVYFRVWLRFEDVFWFWKGGKSCLFSGLEEEYEVCARDNSFMPVETCELG